MNATFPGNALESPVKLAHVVVRVTNLPSSRDWYLRVLGGKVTFENRMACFMTYDDEHHRLGLLAMPGLSAPPPGTTGLEHIAFTYRSLQALLANYRRLAAAGIHPYWCINHGPTISMYYKDPDNHNIELQYDVFRRREDLDAFFAGGAYEENFMGIIFDPEEMIARLASGEPEESVTRRPSLPPGKTPWDMHRP